MNVAQNLLPPPSWYFDISALLVSDSYDVKTSFLLFTVGTVHVDIIEVFYLPTDAQWNCFKRILKFTLKQLLHVSVQSPSSGSISFELAKVIVIKIIS
jgi:hypothetical protein